MIVNLGINDIKELTASMAGYPDMDYSDYAFAFLKRRLSMICKQLHIRRKEQFIEYLSKCAFRDDVKTLMNVETTEMFRDPAFWRHLRDQVIPKLPEDCHTLWLPHEASGEEAFSLAIILHEAGLSDRYKIRCNNPSVKNCENIAAGRINPLHNDINQTNYKRLEDKENYESYFEVGNNSLTVSEQIRNLVQCRHEAFHSQENRDEKIGLIVFRNISIYYNRKLTDNTFRMLVEKLMPGGFLAIGVKEELPLFLHDELITIDKNEKIFQKPSRNRNFNHV